ncbi:MAG: outer membrane protein assembly factor BamD, partial [Chlamydiales bacterium]|nr:outer membrane protein assembly factor BamD [Chlamydiales bacterium]
LAFPREARLEAAEKALLEMRQIYAKNWLETGRYYQKVKKIPAAIIYYRKVIVKYPHTKAAEQATELLQKLDA